jgi:hypothetical protein
MTSYSISSDVGKMTTLHPISLENFFGLEEWWQSIEKSVPENLLQKEAIQLLEIALALKKQGINKDIIDLNDISLLKNFSFHHPQASASTSSQLSG